MAVVINEAEWASIKSSHEQSLKAAQERASLLEQRLAAAAVELTGLAQRAEWLGQESLAIDLRTTVRRMND